MIKALTNEHAFYSFLVFPLVFTNLLQNGFYNFSLGFVFFNLHVFLVAEIIKGKNSTLNWVLLLFNSVLMYYCHLFGFAIALLICSNFILIVFWKNKKKTFKNLGLFLAVHIPTLTFTVIFAIKTKIDFFHYDFQPFEKSMALMTFMPGIVFEKKEELPYTVLITILLISLAANIITTRFQKEGKKLIPVDIFLLISTLIVYLIFHSTDGDFGGMFIHRILILMFSFL
ncbi:MAG: hypothetical protein LCH32_03765 [Bacteroidetes bacterium]|nr:hypothetical protein [Bacteroidota bacterium]